MTAIIAFGFVYFANWCMDSIKHRYNQSIFFKWRWLRDTRFFGYREFWKFDDEARRRRFRGNDPSLGRKKILGITVAQAFTDGWHFWKMIMVGGIIWIAAEAVYYSIGVNFWLLYVLLSAFWLLAWWLMYDVNYGTV